MTPLLNRHRKNKFRFLLKSNSGFCLGAKTGSSEGSGPALVPGADCRLANEQAESLLLLRGEVAPATLRFPHQLRQLSPLGLGEVLLNSVPRFPYEPDGGDPYSRPRNAGPEHAASREQLQGQLRNLLRRKCGSS
jgi:hypothetical protein